MSTKVLDVVQAGVVTGDDLQKLFKIAKDEGFALPAVNVISTGSINAVLEAAKNVNSPVIIQFSNGGGAFYGVSPVRSMCILWLKPMVYRSCFIQTMRQENFFPG